MKGLVSPEIYHLVRIFCQIVHIQNELLLDIIMKWTNEPLESHARMLFLLHWCDIIDLIMIMQNIDNCVEEEIIIM